MPIPKNPIMIWSYRKALCTQKWRYLSLFCAKDLNRHPDLSKTDAQYNNRLFTVLLLETLTLWKIVHNLFVTRVKYDGANLSQEGDLSKRAVCLTSELRLQGKEQVRAKDMKEKQWRELSMFQMTDTTPCTSDRAE